MSMTWPTCLPDSSYALCTGRIGMYLQRERRLIALDCNYIALRPRQVWCILCVL